MLRLRTLLTRSLAPAPCVLAVAACVLGVAACGGSHHAAASTSSTSSGTGAGTGSRRSPGGRTGTGTGTATGAQARVADAHTLYIYSSLPLRGARRAESEQIQQGITFVLSKAHDRVGPYHIKYQPLSDLPAPPAKGRRPKRSVRASADRSALKTVQNAEEAARNPQTVAYIGDLASSATELSLPILNQAGIAQLTPGSGDPRLTTKIPGGTTSLFRLVPNDLVQADAIVYWLKHDVYGCQTAAAAAFGGEAESTELVDQIQQDAKADKLGFVSIPPPASAKDYETYGQTLQHDHVNCFVLAGHVTRAAVAFTTQLQQKLPAGSVIVGTSGLCTPAWTDHARGGVPAKVDPSLYCMSPVLPLAYYPGGRRFGADFRKAEHRAATAYTYYGYLAASLVLQAIRQVGQYDPRRTVLSNLSDNVASTDLDVYTFQPNGELSGDPSANYYRLERVVNGIPRLYKVVKP